MEPDATDFELPDQWQLEGFDDETVEWWLDNGFDCPTAVIWRAGYFDPETAAAWAEVDVDVAEALAWRVALEETEYDIVDALRFWKQGFRPENVLWHLALDEREIEELEDESVTDAAWVGP